MRYPEKISKKEKDLHLRFVEFGKNAKIWKKKCTLLLPEIERFEVWRKMGFGSIYEYAAKLAGMSRNSVDDALRVLKKIEDKPALMSIVKKRGVNAVRPIATIATQENAEFWAGKAKEMSKNTLETYVREYRKVDDKENLNFNMGIRTSTENTNTISMELDPSIVDQLQKLKGQGSWDDLMKQFLKMYEAKLEVEKPEPVKTYSRHIPAKIEKYVIAKTNGTCAYPECTKPGEILHHTQRFSLEKVHDPDRIVLLCKAHERIVHQVLIENEADAPCNWRIRKEADEKDPKYAIDKIVGRFRMPEFQSGFG